MHSRCKGAYIVFIITFNKVFLIHFFEIVKIIRAFWIDVFMYAEKLTVFIVLPLIVFKTKLPVLLDKGFDDRKHINFKFLIFGRMGIIKSLLFERSIFVNKT